MSNAKPQGLSLAISIIFQSFYTIGMLVLTLGTFYVWRKTKKEKNAKGAFERSRARYTSDFILSQTQWYMVTSVALVIQSLIDLVPMIDPSYY